ncbi:hypothetical protein [Chitinophaga sp. CF418]|uniref:hypothetical protein n=1 Tax=Chitinophaga sp. CF418 TaxID=1855287 RepID=UPI000912AB7F|nr:hypothetical protein [Chitinophaga sp. CF418]SHN35785.1 hypothetical protein SAMN05216311_11015 [Chitinophaga sp. CF418]
MKKVILMSGMVTMVMASFNENAKGADATDKGVIYNLSNAIANTGLSVVAYDSTALKVVNAFFDKFKSGASPEELANSFDEKAEMFIPGDMKNVPWIGKRIGRAAITDHFKLLRENIKPVIKDILDHLGLFIFGRSSFLIEHKRRIDVCRNVLDNIPMFSYSPILDAPYVH